MATKTATKTASVNGTQPTDASQDFERMWKTAVDALHREQRYVKQLERQLVDQQDLVDFALVWVRARGRNIQFAEQWLRDAARELARKR
jgi:hypothetical protein